MDATPRFTMGLEQFNAGIEFLCVLVGVYTVTELLKYAENPQEIDGGMIRGYRIKGMGVTREDYRGQWWNVWRSALIGMGIGILPGIGGGTSNLLAYSAAKNQSRYPEKFGTGIKDGIIASETANNAVTGAAMIPLLTLGIPGDAGTAILLAGLMIHNVTPGPLLFEKNPALVYSIFIALLMANLAMIAVEYLGMRIFLRLVRIPKFYILSAVFVLCLIGAFGQNRRFFDVWSILLCGLIGYGLEKFSFPLTPLIMGFILGPIVEINLLRGLMFTRGSFVGFLQRPITAVFLLVTVIYLAYVVWSSLAGRKKKATASG
jgi:putative tricarboxylic transport membrane protein